jgi:small-conductance mechanosensitive channel
MFHATVAAQTLPSLTGMVGESPPVEAHDAPAAAPPAAVATKRAENAELLRLAQRRLDAGGTGEASTAQEVALYKTVETVLAQQEAVDRQIEELRNRQGELDAQRKATRSTPVDRKARVSFVAFDRLKDELAAEEARAKLADDRLEAAKAALEKSQKSLAKAEAKQRQAEEEFNAGKGGPAAAELSTAFEQVRQAASLAAETVALRGKEVTRGELAQRVQRQAVELKREQVNRAAPQVVFSEADLHEQIAQIAKQEEAANGALATAQTRRQAADERVREAQKQLDAGTGDREALNEQLAARRREYERWSDEVDLLTQQLARLAQLQFAWVHRHAIASPVPAEGLQPKPDELATWQRDARGTLDELAREASARIQRMEDLRNDLATVADRAEAAKDGAAAVITSINEQSTHLEEMLRSQQASLVQIESTRRVYLKLLDELGESTLSPTRLAQGALAQVSDFWNKELFSVGEGVTKEYVKVNRAVAGLVVLVLGWLLSRVTSRMFANRFLKRFRLSKDADALLRSMVYYTLVFIVLLIALNTIKVRLTAFTIMGGALAIGVGFGSQTLITNFIGGLIMLAERPIRLGEWIKVDGFDGVVEEVGFRSTKLRTANDHVVTIPNSTLVNDSIENVARRRTIRRLMNVTVNHETPREKLMAAVQAIRDVLEEKGVRERIHPIVGFEDFPPRVYFNDYNASSFNIQIVYWYAPPDWWEYMEHSERVNYRIMEEFDRLGVEFAFPSNKIQLAAESRSKLTDRFLKDGGQRNVA